MEYLSAPESLPSEPSEAAVLPAVIPTGTGSSNESTRPAFASPAGPGMCDSGALPPASALRHDPLPRLFKAVEQAFRQQILHMMRAEGITHVFPGSAPLILHLAEEDGLTMSELGKRCGLENSTLTPLVDELARQNIASRVRDSEDRRVIRLSLTEEGQALAPRLRDVLLRLQEVALADIPTDDLAIMRGVLEQILTNLAGLSSNAHSEVASETGKS